MDNQKSIYRPFYRLPACPWMPHSADADSAFHENLAQALATHHAELNDPGAGNLQGESAAPANWRADKDSAIFERVSPSAPLVQPAAGD